MEIKQVVTELSKYRDDESYFYSYVTLLQMMYTTIGA